MRQFRLIQLKNFIEEFGRGTNPVVEFGAGEGGYLDLLLESGVVGVGIEASSELVQKGKIQARSMFEGHLESGVQLDFKVQRFFSINFLEHTRNPVNFMRALSDLCDFDAVGFIEVPNFEKDLALNRSHDLVAEHLSYFTPQTLRLVCELSGFEVLRVERVWHDDDVVAYVKKRRLLDMRSWDRNNSARASFAEYCTVADNQPLVLWGASHQALTLISMCDALPIRYIVDSSPRKQNCQESVYGIPIYSPERLLSDRVCSVLVAAAGYSMEVVRYLKASGFSGKIAMLSDHGGEVVG
jgi:hypothetical protein